MADVNYKKKSNQVSLLKPTKHKKGEKKKIEEEQTSGTYSITNPHRTQHQTTQHQNKRLKTYTTKPYITQ